MTTFNITLRQKQDKMKESYMQTWLSIHKYYLLQYSYNLQKQYEFENVLGSLKFLWIHLMYF